MGPDDLHYTSELDLSVRRRRVGRHFSYTSEAGTIRDPEMLRRFRSLAIPPAWTDVRICADPLGHLQAVGRDARGRRQYRYHPAWRAERDRGKFQRTARFGLVLPRIRSRVEADLRRPGLPREKVLAAVIRLLDVTHIRVGNEEYVRANRSFGLTTLRTRHVRTDRGELRFRFRGKSGKMHDVRVDDRRLASVVRACLDLPGQELFQYLDDDGQRHPITSTEVNAWLREVTEDEFTAKDFRTWSGTVLVAQAAIELHRVTEPPRRADLPEIYRWVAARLGNTPAVCRKSYIHPDVIAAYLDGRLHAALQAGAADPERAVLSLLLQEG